MKAICTLLLGMLLASSAPAQPIEPKHELFLSVGDAGLIFALEDIVVAVGTLGNVTYGDQEGRFQVSGGYQRHFNRWTSAGVTGSWAGSRKTMYVRGARYDEVERRLLTLMAEGRLHWLRKPAVGLYSGLALGVFQMSDDLASLPKSDDLTGPGIHVILLGVRAGRDVGGFLELGAGFNGFLEAGISGRF